MTDKEKLLAYRATIEARIPETRENIAKVEDDEKLGEEYKVWWTGILRKSIADIESELTGFDNLFGYITNA